MTAAPVIELSQNDLLSAIEGAGLGLWTWEVENDVLTANDNWYYMLGYSPGDFPLSMATWTNMMHPEDAEICKKIAELGQSTPIGGGLPGQFLASPPRFCKNAQGQARYL